jgi:class 3 adenylate cyclase
VRRLLYVEDNEDNLYMLTLFFDVQGGYEILSEYHRAVAEVVAGFDGFVAKYMGDGVLIYFGYPQAHEDDAERGVRAGLAVIEAVGRLNVKSVKLQARVGIARAGTPAS